MSQNNKLQIVLRYFSIYFNNTQSRKVKAGDAFATCAYLANVDECVLDRVLDSRPYTLTSVASEFADCDTRWCIHVNATGEVLYDYADDSLANKYKLANAEAIVLAALGR